MAASPAYFDIDPSGVLYTPKTALRAVYRAMAPDTWRNMASEIAVIARRPAAPSSARVIEWASGTRPLPQWAEATVLVLHTRTWNRIARSEQRDQEYAAALSPVYGAYLGALHAGAEYRLVAPIDAVLSNLFLARAGITQYPGKGGRL